MNPLLRALCLIVLLAPATTVEAAKTKETGRTLVERLNLSSPESAAKAFLEAYASSDYLRPISRCR
jgi:hypothetical protein